MENMAIYNACRAVPPEAQKSFNNGKFSGTDINPMWRIKKLTEIFGAAGVGWYVDNVVERSEVHGEVTMAIVTLNLYVKVDGEWSKPIYGTGGNVLLRKGSSSDEGYKMAYTDALSVACKALGIGADIWFANDRTKYTARNEEPSVLNEPEALICEECGGIIIPTRKNGEIVRTSEEVARATKEHFGVQLCARCARKRNDNNGG